MPTVPCHPASSHVRFGMACVYVDWVAHARTQKRPASTGAQVGHNDCQQLAASRSVTENVTGLVKLNGAR